MSSDDIARVERAFEAWNSNDWETMETFFDPEIELIAPPDWPEAGEFKGWPEARRQLERLKDAWGEEKIELVTTRAAGDRIAADFRWVTKGGSSGMPFEAPMHALYTFRDGRCTELRFFSDRSEALAAQIKEQR